jgi:hypothetical protein
LGFYESTTELGQLLISENHYFLKDFKTEKPSKNIQLESYHVSNQFEYVGVEEKTERAIFRPIKTSQPSNFFRYFNFFKKIIKK